MRFKFNIQKFIVFMVLVISLAFNYILYKTISIKDKHINNHIVINTQANKDKEKLKQHIQNKDKELQLLKIHNNDLSKQNTKYENTVKRLLSIGKKPQNYFMPEIIHRGSYERYKNKMKPVGEWIATFYACVPSECGNNKGITKSGVPVTLGKTAAIDERYYKLGTKLYIEGYGIWVCEDTGIDIKGKNRIDLCTASTAISHSGSFNVKVWIIKE